MLTRHKVILKNTLYRHAFVTHVSYILRFLRKMSVCKYYMGPKVSQKLQKTLCSELLTPFVMENMQGYTWFMGHSVIKPVVSNL